MKKSGYDVASDNSTIQRDLRCESQHVIKQKQSTATKHTTPLTHTETLPPFIHSTWLLINYTHPSASTSIPQSPASNTHQCPPPPHTPPNCLQRHHPAVTQPARRSNVPHPPPNPSPPQRQQCNPAPPPSLPHTHTRTHARMHARTQRAQALTA